MIVSQVEKKDFRKEDQVDFVRMVDHAFGFEQNINLGVRWHQGFLCFSALKESECKKKKEKSNCQFLFL